MARVRPAVLAALLILLLAVSTAAAAVPRRPAEPMAAVGWPPSAGLVVAEIVTGGASASDEYVELANAGIVPADLAGLEVAYATSSGATVTRKAAWTASLVLAPGQHLLLANSLGTFAAIADGVYSSGLASTGGAIILRATGGAVVDAVGWGDAANTFVEGSAAPAPGPGESIERRPGGSAGNWADTNDNAADFMVNAAPAPQGRSSGPVPPSASPSPSATPEPTASVPPSATPSPSASPDPSPSATDPGASPSPSAAPSGTPVITPPPSPEPTPSPSPTGPPSPSAPPSTAASVLPTAPPSPSPSVEPTAFPTPEPSAAPSSSPEPTAAPSESPTPPPTSVPTTSPAPSWDASPTPQPTPAPATSIGDARRLPDGTAVVVEGALTTALGALESGRTGFVQDATGGIAVYLDAAYPIPIPAGTLVHVVGTVGSRYGERTLRAVGTDVSVLGMAGLPAPIDVTTGAAGELLEGYRLRVAGIVTEAPATLADGLGVTVDDGSGPLRLVVAPDALGDPAVAFGMTVTAVGPLGQRDSTGTGSSGYRLFATLPGEFSAQPTVQPSGSPEPSASPVPSPASSSTPDPSASALGSPDPTPTPSGDPTASPSATPSATPSVSPPGPSPTPTAPPAPVVLTVSAARQVPVGGSAVVRGVVTAEAGRLGLPAVFAIGDDIAGLPVRLADGMTAPGRGALVEVSGAIAAPYGQTELRLAPGGLAVLGTAAVPAAQSIGARQVGEAVEGRLVAIGGTISVAATRTTSGDLTLTVRGSDGATLRVYADASSGLTAALLKKGLTADFRGIVGQRASRKGALDGYRLWLRDRGDVAPPSSGSSSAPGSTPAPGASATASPDQSARPALEPIVTARVRDGAAVTVEGVVTAGRSLLDASGRRAVLADATGAIELYLAVPNPAVRLGARLRVAGVVGRAWGAPRLRVQALEVLGTASAATLVLRTAPGPATEWQLVRVSGAVTSVHRAGARWVAELDTAFGAVPVIALTGTAIPAAAIEKGRMATVTGIVRRPLPTASDRRYAVLPRSVADIALGPASASPSAGGGRGERGAGGAPGTGEGSSSGPASAAAVDLRDLGAQLGRRIRVGGVVTEVTGDGLRIDDGTATAQIVLAGTAADLVAVMEPGDALDAAGTVQLRDEPVVVVEDPADVVLAADLVTVEASAPASPAALAAVVVDPGSPSLGAAMPPSDVPGPVSLTVVLMAMTGACTAGLIAARRVRDRRRQLALVRRRLDAWASPSVPAAGETWASPTAAATVDA